MKKETIASKRKPGGFSRHLDYVHLCLARRSRGRSARKAMALLEVAKLLRVVARQAQLGDKECGYFLSEMLPIFWKTRDGLAKSNQPFKTYFPRMESAHFATGKDSPLRRMVHRIIKRAKSERQVLEIARLIRESSLVNKSNDRLLALPDLTDSEEAIDAWTNGVVYPRLRRMASRLRRHPVIGKLRKALDENGKFQVSRLKPLIRQTVARIAALPPRYYFDIE
jgi:hypothetical protein